MIKIGLIFGGAYLAGGFAGDKLATVLTVKDPTTRSAIKLGTGVVAFLVLSSVLR